VNHQTNEYALVLPVIAPLACVILSSVADCNGIGRPQQRTIVKIAPAVHGDWLSDTDPAVPQADIITTAASKNIFLILPIVMLNSSLPPLGRELPSRRLPLNAPRR
jgi:hypothetical protein